jgi:hypothetical protein
VLAGVLTVDGIAGSYIAARFAPRRPMRNAVILGVFGIVMSTIGAVLTGIRGQPSGLIGIPSRSS